MRSGSRKNATHQIVSGRKRRAGNRGEPEQQRIDRSKNRDEWDAFAMNRNSQSSPRACKTPI